MYTCVSLIYMYIYIYLILNFLIETHVLVSIILESVNIPVNQEYCLSE